MHPNRYLQASKGAKGFQEVSGAPLPEEKDSKKIPKCTLEDPFVKKIG